MFSPIMLRFVRFIATHIINDYTYLQTIRFTLIMCQHIIIVPTLSSKKQTPGNHYYFRVAKHNHDAGIVSTSCITAKKKDRNEFWCKLYEVNISDSLML